MGRRSLPNTTASVVTAVGSTTILGRRARPATAASSAILRPISPSWSIASSGTRRPRRTFQCGRARNSATAAAATRTSPRRGSHQGAAGS
ncbi:hypothetical protein ACIBK9_43045 [Nonomuraea sp. NPDC050227]|uniref:hypothetical protein n=1 Tax=Nonomuraea sp. NPDC050227 TaxID=3364360 RepID=UPI0037B3EFD6